jgi:phage major head subunit gpT-like protein
MLINEQNLDLVFKGFKSVYSEASLQARTHKDKIAMTVPSSGRDETYSWLGQFPQLREWIGPRHVHSLKAHSFTIVNRRFESTVAVKRDDISDEKLGVFKPAFSEMGYLARNHPEELVFGLLAQGFGTVCYDGQNFF